MGAALTPFGFDREMAPVGGDARHCDAAGGAQGETRRADDPTDFAQKLARRQFESFESWAGDGVALNRGELARSRERPTLLGARRRTILGAWGDPGIRHGAPAQKKGARHLRR